MKLRNLIIAVLAIMCPIAVLFSVGVGAVQYNYLEVLNAIFDADSKARLIIFELRFPRTLAAGMVGVCLSLSGCILQGIMRNSLASPSTIGVTSGASFVGYMTLVVFPASAHLLPIGSIVGAFSTTLLIYALAYRKGVSPVKMILSGMAVSSLFGAFNDMIRTVFADKLGDAVGFLVGGLNGVVWDEVRMLLPYMVVGILATFILPARLNILALGDETANSLGLQTERFRFILICISSLLAGAAIAAAGMISFVGLMVPHLARLMVGSDYRKLFPASAFLGFFVVVMCDAIGRIVMAPSEVPVSVIMSFIGAPFFLYLLRSRGEVKG